MLDWLLQSGSYLGIFLFMVLTGCGLPLPEEVAIVFAGVRSAQGELVTPVAFIACLLGALIGDAAMYGIGRRFGHSLMRRKPKLAKLLHADREQQFEGAIHRHGFKVLLISRFMVGVRGPVYLAAGAIRMPFGRFLLWDSVCATTVVSVFFALSYYLGEALEQEAIGRLVRDTEVLVTVTVLALVAVITYLALRRRRQRLLAAVLEDAAKSEPSRDVEVRDAS